VQSCPKLPGQSNEARRRFHDLELQLVASHDLKISHFSLNFILNESSIATSSVEILESFESLGGAPFGCEFGFVQRERGVEPLGLLRWASTEPYELIKALEEEFDGVGTADQTELYVNTDNDPEYAVRDRRYGIQTHTFVMHWEVPADKLHQQICKRMQFLRRELIEDLKEGRKIFIYRVNPILQPHMERSVLNDGELERLSRALNHYGKNTLLYITALDGTKGGPIVSIKQPGLMIGYLPRFCRTPHEIDFAAWDAICVEAYKLWRDVVVRFTT
jgi:hypothetical protein